MTLHIPERLLPTKDELYLHLASYDGYGETAIQLAASIVATSILEFIHGYVETGGPIEDLEDAIRKILL